MPKIPEVYEDLYACLQCGYCNTVCPTFYPFGLESASPRGRIYLLRRNEERSFLDRLYKTAFDLDEKFATRLFQCSTCGACTLECPVDIDLDAFWDHARAWAVSEGIAPIPAHAELRANVESTHNIYGKSHEDRASWLPDDIQLSDTPDVVFWVGCAMSYERQEAAIGMARIMQAAGERFTILGGDEWCTGHPLQRAGQVDIVENTLAWHNVREVLARGARSLVTACAECYYSFTRDYPPITGLHEFEVLHAAEYIQRLAKEKRLKLPGKLDMTVAFHDPCYLGRKCGKYDETRAALRAVPGVKTVEFRDNREKAACCGSGGGFGPAFPKEALDIAVQRAREAKEAGADAIASACPFCTIQFDKALKRIGADMEALDVVELAGRALAPLPPPPAAPQEETAVSPNPATSPSTSAPAESG